MATKEDVKYFITAVKAKAIKAIDAKHKEGYEKAVTGYIINYQKELSSKLEIYRDLMYKASELGKEIHSELGLARYCTLASEFTGFNTDLKIFEQLYSSGKLDKKVAREYHYVDNALYLKKAWEDEVASTREEYDKIIREISRNCRDGRSALRLVKSLGFDTSSIEEKSKEELKFDKEKLFVCGEDRA